MKNIGNLMKQAQELQTRMTEVQSELEEMEISGQSGGGLVAVTLTGKGDMKALDVDPSLMKADEKEILEDLVIAAHADAKAKMEKAVAEKMKAVTGNLSLPPGFNLGI